MSLANSVQGAGTTRHPYRYLYEKLNLVRLAATRTSRGERCEILSESQMRDVEIHALELPLGVIPLLETGVRLPSESAAQRFRARSGA